MKERAFEFLKQHPRLTNWIIMAVGMVIIFVWAARGQGFTVGQYIGLLGSCIVLAGACAWIIGWE